MRSIRQVALLATGETVARGLAWLTVFTLPWFLAKEEYGLVILLSTFEGVATGFLLLGQDRALLWRITGPADDRRNRTSAASAALVTASACVAALLICTMFVAGGRRLLGVPVWPHIWLLLIAVAFGNMNRVALAFARATDMTHAFVANRSVVGVAILCITLGLGFATRSALSFPVGMALGIAAGGWWLWLRLLPDRRSFKRVFGELPLLLRFGAPLSGHLLAMSTIRLIDRWVIGGLLGLAAVGSYGWYYMVGSGVVFLYAALSVSYEPRIYREYQGDQRTDSLREFLGTSLSAAGLYGLVGSGVALFAAGIVPDSVQADPSVARIVLVAHWLYAPYLAANYLLSSVGKTVHVAGLAIATLACVTAANMVLVPAIGSLGGAWSTLIGSVVLVIVSLLVLAHLGLPSRPVAGACLVVVLLGLFVLYGSGLTSLAFSSMLLVLYGGFVAGFFRRDLGRARSQDQAGIA